MTIVSFDIFNSVIGDSTKASTMPMNRRSVPSLTPRALSQYEGMGEPGHSKSLPSCISTTGLRPSLVGAFWCLIFFFYGWLFLFLGRNTTSLLLNVTNCACNMIASVYSTRGQCLQYDRFQHLYTSLLANLKNLSITCPKGCLAGDSVALE